MVAIAATAIIPLLIVPAFYDPFRQPKLLALHAAGIVLSGVVAIAVIQRPTVLGQVIRRRLPDRLVVAILVWTFVTALLASHRRVALFGALTAVSAAALFLILRSNAHRLRIPVLLAVVAPAALNASIAILQELKIWNEIAPVSVRQLHAGTTALLGNPNDVGTCLTPALIVAVAWALATRSVAWRVVLAPTVLLIASGVMASRTRGAMLGGAVGLVTLAVVRWRTAGLLRVGVTVVVIALLAMTYAPLLERIVEAPIQELVTGRIIAFATAWEMVTDTPVFGVGPGCFQYAYFDYASRVYPSILDYAVAGRQHMFGEAHNDHLQVAAETGLVGYLLFIASLVAVGATSRRHGIGQSSERVRFANLCGAPLAAALAALSAFQFPLYLAPSLTAFVFAAALAIGWSEDEPVA